MTQKNKSRESTISFRCQEQWKREITAKCALRGQDMRVACIEALSKHLGLSVPKEA